MEKIGTYFWDDTKETAIPYYIQSLKDELFIVQNVDTKQVYKKTSKELESIKPANESTIKNEFENLINSPEFSDSSILYQLRRKLMI